MKKLIAFMLALCLAVSLFGCGSADSEPTTTTGDQPNSDAPNYKSYTVSDQAAAAARLDIVATVGDRELTVGELNVCYWMGVYSFLNNYGSYASLYGLDYTQPLDTQGPTGQDSSWQEFFIEDALSAWHLYQAMALKGQEMGVTMPEEMQTDLDGLRDVMAESAEKGNFESVDAMIQAEAGAASDADSYYNYTLHYYEYLACLTYLDQTTEITQEQIDQYFLDHEEELAESEITKDSGDVCSVRHILISPKGGTTDSSGNTTYSDEAWEECRKEAQKLMDEWASGTATEETFANYAKTYSTDTGSKSNGGLYEGLNEDTSFVEPFKNWYLEEGRKAGDYGLVKTDYGYHIMYYSGSEPAWIYHCREALYEEFITNFIKEAKEAYPIETDMDKVVIGNVNLVSSS